MATCPQCLNDYPSIHIGTDGLCYGCHLDTYIPPDYQAREQYVWHETWRHHNATQRPDTGVPFLDKHNDVWTLLALSKRKPRI